MTCCRIKNPLLGIPKEQLFADVEAFAHDNDLVDIIPDMKKGALVAQNPFGIDNIAELDDADRAIINLEQTNRWKHPKILYLLPCNILFSNLRLTF